MKPGKKGRFIISLDFELFWGVRDKRTIESYGANIRGVREVIPRLLDLFDTYGIHATFATVGFLFAKDRNELLSFSPQLKPDYSNPKYSPYASNYLQTIGNSEADDVYHYGASLVRMIQQHPKQEIATHTFSHYYCLEQAAPESFRADLQAAINIAAQWNITLKSIVFPRNQYSRRHLDICRELGILCYRGNEASVVYKPRKNDEQGKLIRGVRLTDSYLNLTGHHSFTIDDTEPLINIPASRFLRPYSDKLKIADRLRLSRIQNSMTHAATHQQAFHLWWHPHNFGVNTKENMDFLEKILRHYRMLHETKGMQSETMGEIAEQILVTHAQ